MQSPLGGRHPAWTLLCLLSAVEKASVGSCERKKVTFCESSRGKALNNVGKGQYEERKYV